MNLTKLLIATIASFIVMFALGGFVHMKLLHQFYMDHMGAAGSMMPAEANMKYIIAAILLLAFIMSYMYPKGVETNNKIMEGFKFGAIIGILWMIPLDLILHGSMALFTKKLILVDAGVGIIIQGIGGIVIAYAYGDSARPRS